MRTAGGRVLGPWQIPDAQATLADAWSGRTLLLLTGDSPTAEACCSSAAIVPVGSSGRFGRAHALVSGLAGSTLGELVPLGRRALAAVATNRGVWVAQSSRSGRWGRTRRLAGAQSQPEALAATGLSGGGGALVWAGAPDSDVGPRRLVLASGSATRPPSRSHAALTVPGTDGIDQIVLAPRGSGVTAAWVEDWYDRHGNYHSEVRAEDLRPGARPTGFPIAGTMASGVDLAADGHGDQLLAWAACTWSGACSVRASERPAGKSFGRPVRLGSIDATEAPVVAVFSGGGAVLAWISGGHVVARELRHGSTRFSATQSVSRSTDATDLAVAAGPANAAFATWTQGDDAPEVLGALFRG